MKNQKKNLHIPEPVLLHIFSYQHGSFCNIVQKKLSKYAKEDYDFNKTKLPISLILSSDLLMEINKDVLINKMKIPRSFTPNWVNPSIILVAARHNNLQAMKWLESNILCAANTAKKIIIWPKGTQIMSVVARDGNLEMIQWLKEMKCPIDRNTFSEAARGCHVEVLDELQESYGWPEESYGWPDSTCDAIAFTGRLDILQWALDKGCPWDARCASTCARFGHTDMFRWILDERFFINVVDICSNAASGGHLQLLQLAREYDCPWDENTFHCAARSGNFQLIKWARNNGCRWDANTCTAAARLGQLEILQWLREENCPWDAQTCAVAAERAHLHVLEWARSRECPCQWDESTCSAAAKYGRLQILQWAREKGCPWDKGTCEGAAKHGYLEILQWARENGCPWDEETTRIAARCHRLDLLCWAIENGCPIKFNECVKILMNSCDSKNETYPCASCFRAIWEGDLVNYKEWKSGCPMKRSGCLNAANSNLWERLMKWVACEELVPANSD
jgi:hypothetical protein